MTTAVLDAAALLAFLQDEPGSDLVEDALVSGALISAVNWAEVLSKVVDYGDQPEATIGKLAKAGILAQSLRVVPFTGDDALASAHLRNKTKRLGLSIGDRACLVLSLRERLVALTTDKSWSELRIGATVRVIR